MDDKNATITALDNQVFKSLNLENDSSEFIYRILLKNGYKGTSSINLNSIDEAYMISYNDSSIANIDFHLLPNTEYSITNYSVPDAGEHTIYFLLIRVRTYT